MKLTFDDLLSIFCICAAFMWISTYVSVLLAVLLLLAFLIFFGYIILTREIIPHWRYVNKRKQMMRELRRQRRRHDEDEEDFASDYNNMFYGVTVWDGWPY